MPTPMMRVFAKEAGKKTKTVEKIWKQSEDLVREKYGIDEESPRFYPLVVGVVKNTLGIRKKEMVKEEEGGEVADPGMTTTTMGDYQFAPMLGRMITFPTMNNAKVSTPKKRRSYRKRMKKIKSVSEEKGLDYDSALSEFMNLAIKKHEDMEDVIDESIDIMLRYLGIEPSIIDEI